MRRSWANRSRTAGRRRIDCRRRAFGDSPSSVCRRIASTSPSRSISRSAAPGHLAQALGVRGLLHRQEQCLGRRHDDAGADRPGGRVEHLGGRVEQRAHTLALLVRHVLPAARVGQRGERRARLVHQHADAEQFGRPAPRLTRCEHRGVPGPGQRARVERHQWIVLQLPGVVGDRPARVRERGALRAPGASRPHPEEHHLHRRARADLTREQQRVGEVPRRPHDREHDRHRHRGGLARRLTEGPEQRGPERPRREREGERRGPRRQRVSHEGGQEQSARDGQRQPGAATEAGLQARHAGQFRTERRQRRMRPAEQQQGAEEGDGDPDARADGHHRLADDGLDGDPGPGHGLDRAVPRRTPAVQRSVSSRPAHPASVIPPASPPPIAGRIRRPRPCVRMRPNAPGWRTPPASGPPLRPRPRPRTRNGGGSGSGLVAAGSPPWSPRAAAVAASGELIGIDGDPAMAATSGASPTRSSATSTGTRPWAAGCRDRPAPSNSPDSQSAPCATRSRCPRIRPPRKRFSVFEE